MSSNNVIIDESAKRILENTIFSGKKYLNTLEEVNVAGYAEAQISAADTIIPSNIKKDVTILGVEGEYEGKAESYRISLVSESTQFGDIELEIGRPKKILKPDESIYVDRINLDEEGDFRIIANLPDTAECLFSGKYDGETYDKTLYYHDSDNEIFTPTGDSRWKASKIESDLVLSITTKAEKQYIYEKGEDSDVEFDLYDSAGKVNEGKNLHVSGDYHIASKDANPFQEPVDIYINNTIVSEGSSDTYWFFLLEDMSVNNKVVITVKKHTDEVTLTYALGKYGTGSVPDPVTTNVGHTVDINFAIVPSYDGDNKFFVGWATTDGAEEATYKKDDTTSITMTENVTLYPVFAAAAGYIEFDNSNGNDTVKVLDDKEQTVLTVPVGEVKKLYFTARRKYYIGYENGATDPATFKGVYRRNEYNTIDLTIGTRWFDGTIKSPYNQENWIFEKGDNGTIVLNASTGH